MYRSWRPAESCCATIAARNSPSFSCVSWTRGGFRRGSSRPARKAVAAAIADLKAGKPIFVGPLKDNKGNVVIDKTLGLYDGVLWQTNYLLEGIVGSVT